MSQTYFDENFKFPTVVITPEGEIKTGLRDVGYQWIYAPIGTQILLDVDFFGPCMKRIGMSGIIREDWEYRLPIPEDILFRLLLEKREIYEKIKTSRVPTH